MEPGRGGNWARQGKGVQAEWRRRHDRVQADAATQRKAEGLQGKRNMQKRKVLQGIRMKKGIRECKRWRKH